MSQYSNADSSDYFKLQNNKMNTVIAIIPAYNESQKIVDIINSTLKYVTSVIVVDDGSNDETSQLASTTGAKVIRNNRNIGKGNAIKRGLFESLKYNPDIIVTIDADGQHDPKDIPKLLKPIKDGMADIVIGSRYEDKTLTQIPLLRGFGLSIINSLNKTLLKSNVKDSQSGFRAYDKRIFLAVCDYDSDGYGAETEQIAQAEIYGAHIVEVPITIKYKGIDKTSKKNPVGHAMQLVSIILKISVEKRPLLFFGLGGIILIVISLIPLTNMLVIFNETRYFSIPLALIVLGLVFIGTLLLVLSFILYALKRIRQKLSISRY